MASAKDELRLQQLEKAVGEIGDAMAIFQEFMLSAKTWARAGGLMFTILLGVVQPLAVALIINLMGGK